MTIAESLPPDVGAGTAAYPNAGETGRLRGGRLRFFRTIAESVGVQAPTAGVLITAAGIAVPFVYWPLWRGIQHSPLLRVGADALLGTRTGDREVLPSRGDYPFSGDARRARARNARVRSRRTL
jgi:hypothetical protein